MHINDVSGGCGCFCGPDNCGVCHNCGADLGWREQDRSPEANRNREAERAAIVKWLRDPYGKNTFEGDTPNVIKSSDWRAMTPAELADAIERGEHLK